MHTADIQEYPTSSTAEASTFLTQGSLMSRPVAAPPTRGDQGLKGLTAEAVTSLRDQEDQFR